MDTDTIDINQFVKGYIAAALWSTTDCREDDPDGKNPFNLDEHFDRVSDICYIAMTARCAEFVRDNYHKLLTFKTMLEHDHCDLGHDFWLTSSGHGAGFWDRGAGDLGQELSDAARPYGTFEIFGDFEAGVVRSHHWG